jgi:hypothetical protein
VVQGAQQKILLEQVVLIQFLDLLQLSVVVLEEAQLLLIMALVLPGEVKSEALAAAAKLMLLVLQAPQVKAFAVAMAGAMVLAVEEEDQVRLV